MLPLLLVLVAVIPADAAMLCARPKSDATLNATVKVREACKGTEVRLGIVSLAPLEVADEAAVTTTTTTTLSPSSSTTTSSVPGSSTTTTTLASRWIDNGDGTISDLLTGLMWEKLSDDGSIHDWNNGYSWQLATSEKLALLNLTAFAGYSDWRLPARLELESILDLSLGTPGPTVPIPFNSACTFGCTVVSCSCTNANNYYWSSTPYISGPGVAWAVHFADGDGGPVSMGGSLYVRAVRGGPFL